MNNDKNQRGQGSQDGSRKSDNQSGGQKRKPEPIGQSDNQRGGDMRYPPTDEQTPGRPNRDRPNSWQTPTGSVEDEEQT